MERRDILDMLATLKLAGMRAAFDEIIATVAHHLARSGARPGGAAVRRAGDPARKVTLPASVVTWSGLPGRRLPVVLTTWRTGRRRLEAVVTWRRGGRNIGLSKSPLPGPLPSRGLL